MRHFYKLFTALRTVFYAISFILVAGFAPVASASNGDPVFTVQGIEVDVTADNAAAAREEAFGKAQYTAFQRLTERLLPDNQKEYFNMPEASVISALVKDFEITNEKLSNVRYIGTYTFRFQNDAVRNYLGSQGFAYSDVGSKPVLVLPFYQWGSRTLLWDENNPWLAAWTNSRSFQGLVPAIVPIGDVQDVSDIGDNEALTYKPEQLAAMVERYGAGEAIILLATPEWNGSKRANAEQLPDKLKVMIYHTAYDRPQFSNKLTITKAEAWNAPDIFAAAVEQSRTALQQDWKSQTVTNAAQGNMLKVRVKFGNMQEWIETQKKLRRVQGVNNMKLLSLKQNEANIELQFQGTEDRLRLALAQADMTLSEPQVSYNTAASYNRYSNDPYGYHSQQRSSPLIYDLYMNKYYKPYP